MKSNRPRFTNKVIRYAMSSTSIPVCIIKRCKVRRKIHTTLIRQISRREFSMKTIKHNQVPKPIGSSKFHAFANSALSIAISFLTVFLANTLEMSQAFQK